MVRVLFHLVDVDETDVGLFPIATHIPLIVMLWDDLLQNFAVAELLIVDQTSEKVGASVAAEHPQWRIFERLSQAEAAFPAATWVYFEHGGQPLDGFDHPGGDVVYAFGPDSTGFELMPGKTHVEIPTARPYGFFSPLAAAIALYDRRMRAGARDIRS